MKKVHVFFLLIKSSIKAQLGNKKDFIIQMVIWFMFTITPYLGLQILFQRFSLINNVWTIWQVSVLYSILGASYDCARMFARSLDSFHRYVKRGNYDAVLIRPLPVFEQLLSQDFFVRRVAGIVQYFFVFILATYHLRGTIRILLFLFVSFFAFLSCFLIFLGLLTFYASICFYTKDRNLFSDMVVDTTATIGYLPTTRYFAPIRFVFTWCIPLYFVLYSQFNLLFSGEYGIKLLCLGFVSLLISFVYFFTAFCVFYYFQRKYVAK